MKLCTATHPMMPNYSGLSRGRKYHYTLDGVTTLCNMLVDQLLTEWEGRGNYPEDGETFAPSIESNGQCGNCRITADRKYLKIQRTRYDARARG